MIYEMSNQEEREVLLTARAVGLTPEVFVQAAIAKAIQDRAKLPEFKSQMNREIQSLTDSALGLIRLNTTLMNERK